MENGRKTEEFASVVFARPLAPVTERELRVLHGPAMEKARRALHRALARQRAADLVVSCAQKAEKLTLGIVETVGDVVANVFNAGFAMPEPVYVTRGMGAHPRAEVSGSDRIEMMKQGEGAKLKMTIETAASRCDVRVRLEDASTGELVAPLNLYIEDRETGKTLLPETSYSSGEAVLRGVEPGEYWIEAESGGKSAEMALKVEGVGR